MLPVQVKAGNQLNGDFPFCLREEWLILDTLPHGHDFIEFTYVFYGSGKEIINGTEHLLKPGTLIVLFPHQIHQIFRDKDSDLGIFVGYIGMQALWGTDYSLLILKDLLLADNGKIKPYTYLNNDIAVQVHTLLKKMLDEFNGRSAWKQTIYKAKLAELLVLFGRNQVPSENIPDKPSNSANITRIFDIFYYIYMNFHEDITLKTLSERYYLSIPHLSNMFKQHLGENFHVFLTNIRIARACNLLTSSTMPITEIVYESGFKAYPTFSRVFHNYTGLSPMEYRKTYLSTY